MSETKKPLKLFGAKQVAIVLIAICAGLGFAAYRIQSQKGYFTLVDVVSLIFAGVIGLGISGIVIWYGNKPEK